MSTSKATIRAAISTLSGAQSQSVNRHTLSVTRLTRAGRGIVAAMACSLAVPVAPLLATAPDSPSQAQSDGERTLPEPEHWQPGLDPALPDFRGCAEPGPRAPIEGSAPAILPDLIARWIAAFTAHCRASITVPPPYGPPQASGSPTLRKFLAAKSDFAFMTRDLTAADLAAFRKAHGRSPLVVPVAAGSYRHFGFVDAVAVIVNRDNPLTRLSLAQLDSIFSKTRWRGKPPPSDWGALGVSGWAGRPIHIVGAGGWIPIESARASFVRRTVFDVDHHAGIWRTDIAAITGEADTPARVAADRDAIGFTGLGHLVAGDKTVAIALTHRGPAIAPTYDNVASGRYPLARTIDLLVAPTGRQPLNPALCDFARFMLSREGQQAILDQGVFLPLRLDQVARSRALIAPNCP